MRSFGRVAMVLGAAVLFCAASFAQSGGGGGGAGGGASSGGTGGASSSGTTGAAGAPARAGGTGSTLAPQRPNAGSLSPLAPSRLQQPGVPNQGGVQQRLPSNTPERN